MTIDLALYRPLLHNYLREYLESHGSFWSSERWGSDVLKRLVTFTVNGKLLRGSLCLMAYNLFTDDEPESVVPLAAALECMQSALLIHDDIIDQDDMRRGQPSFMAQYRQVAQDAHYPGIQHAGASLALCVGDISMFLAFELLGKLSLPVNVGSSLVQQFAQEYQLVGLGEMADVHLGWTDKLVSKEDILSVYRTKTARYTLVVPILLAGVAAQVDKVVLSQLDNVTEKMGLLFQIKDDELGLYGSDAEIGKPNTSDVREGKKTLYYYYGFTLASGEDRRILERAFGNPLLTEVDLQQVRKTLEKVGAVAQVENDVAELQQQISHEITELTDQKWQSFLNQLLAFNAGRKK